MEPTFLVFLSVHRFYQNAEKNPYYRCLIFPFLQPLQPFFQYFACKLLMFLHDECISNNLLLCSLFLSHTGLIFLIRTAWKSMALVAFLTFCPYFAHLYSINKAKSQNFCHVIVDRSRVTDGFTVTLKIAEFWDFYRISFKQTVYFLAISLSFFCLFEAEFCLIFTIELHVVRE